MVTQYKNSDSLSSCIGTPNPEYACSGFEKPAILPVENRSHDSKSSGHQKDLMTVLLEKACPG
jgi:hypothetical protein